MGGNRLFSSSSYSDFNIYSLVVFLASLRSHSFAHSPSLASQGQRQERQERNFKWKTKTYNTNDGDALHYFLQWWFLVKMFCSVLASVKRETAQASFPTGKCRRFATTSLYDEARHIDSSTLLFSV